MSLTVQIEPPRGATPSVSYTWDTDTDILSAQVDGSAPEGPVATVELQGHDGSWMIFDVKGGRVRGVEVAVWPDVRKLPALEAPADAQQGRLVVPSARPEAGVSVLQMDTPLVAEADQTDRTIHFRLGAKKTSSRTVCIA